MTANRRRSGQGRRPRSNGWSAKWSDELRIRPGEKAWVIITAGDYPLDDGDRASWLEVDMYNIEYQNQWGNTSWSYFRGNEGDCTLAKQAQANHPKLKKPVPGKPRIFLNAIHLDTFRQTQVLDKKTKQPLMYSKGKLRGQPILRWENVTDPMEKKNIARSGDFDGVCFFRKKFLQMSFNQFDAIRQVAKQAKQNCECGGCLEPVVYVCSECEDILLDISTTSLRPSEVTKFAEDHVRCGSCGHVDYPKAESICDNCDDPRPTVISSYAILLSKVRKDGFWTLQVEKVTPLTDWKFPSGTYAAARDADDNIILEEDLQKLADVQFDLEAYTEPKSNAYYSDILNLREGDIGFVSEATDYGNFR